jgi:hypothetical protein
MAMLHHRAFSALLAGETGRTSHWRTYAYRGIADGAPSFELALQPDKARLIRFGRYAARPNSGRLGEGKPETFGFWHHAFLDAITQMGSFVIGRKTINNRMGAKPPAIKTELRGTMPDSIAKTGALIKRMLQGHLNYFAVSGNHPAVVVLQSGEKAVADVAQVARPDSTPQLGEVRPARRSLLSANQDATPPAMSPPRRQNPREEARCVSVARRDLCEGRCLCRDPPVSHRGW